MCKYFYTSEPIVHLQLSAFLKQQTAAAKLNIFIPVNFLRSQFDMSCSKTSLKLPYNVICVHSTKAIFQHFCAISYF